MLRCSCSHIRHFLAPVLLLVAPTMLLAQGGDDPLLGVSFEKLDQDASKYRSKINELMQGKASFEASDPEQVKAIEVAAQYAVYRFWDPRIERPQRSGDPSSDKVFQEFEDLQLQPLLKNKENNGPLVQLYTKKMIEFGDRVLQSSKPIARLNAARVLERLTLLGQPELADELLKALNDEVNFDAKKDPRRNDGVKLYALRGLGKMLTLQDRTPPVLKKATEDDILIALTQFVERKPLLDKNPTSPEVDGWRALRREAVRALAHGRQVTVGPKAQPGMVLLRVMAKDGVTPEPRMDERLEAAIGVCRLSPERDKKYQPEYAAYQLGLFVDALVGYVGKAKEEQKPMKVYAARLLDALEGMRVANPKNDSVSKVIAQCLPLLAPLQEKGTITNSASQDLFIRWLAANPSKKDSLIEGDKGATVKAANRREEAPEK
jgi:hypothetical protein